MATGTHYDNRFMMHAGKAVGLHRNHSVWNRRNYNLVPSGARFDFIFDCLNFISHVPLAAVEVLASVSILPTIPQLLPAMPSSGDHMNCKTLSSPIQSYCLIHCSISGSFYPLTQLTVLNTHPCSKVPYPAAPHFIALGGFLSYKASRFLPQVFYHAEKPKTCHRL